MRQSSALLLSLCWLLAAIAGLWWLLDHSPEPQAGQVRRVQFDGMPYLIWPNGQLTLDAAAERAFELKMQAATAEFFISHAQPKPPAEPTPAPPPN
jgi:hypothetical protein